MPALERLAWTAAAWDDTLHWQSQDRRQLRRINQLIQACLRDPFDGIGKPEPLRENLASCWSRRIDDEHRLVYRLDGELLVILACRVHYRKASAGRCLQVAYAAVMAGSELVGWLKAR